ncbi:disulfide bond formation protein DsbB [Sphingomonas jinjuensis]|uniref:Disulfide bond formation protein DsbB n=1 Tax=Sphingomonas jinjuensis TaxID=535907 RepID=A0A840FDS4_9SPHN|nr:disulfide bond formation protein B [Sphingomonas jinjuensis]MBB4154812.1 disulfide bond formation protein DsbB [Sphingomonas jinjuensis]
MTPSERLARLLALLVPAALLAGAWIGQLFFHLYPCEMCHWQRWPHYAAVVLAGLAFVVPQRSVAKSLIIVAALLIAISGAIGVFHAGVEWHWWNGFTACTGSLGSGGSTLDRIMNTAVIPCDVAQWRFLGISLAGYNALISLAGAALILGMMRKAR